MKITKIYFIIFCFISILNCKLTLNTYKEYSSLENVTPLISKDNIKIYNYFIDDFNYFNFTVKISENSKLKISDYKFSPDKHGIIKDRVRLNNKKKVTFEILQNNKVIQKYVYEDYNTPDEPQNLYADSVNQREIEVSWDKNNEPDILGYNVYYRYMTHSWEKFNRDSHIISKPEYTLTGLNKGHTYYIKVTAYDRFRNESNYSDVISVKTLGETEDCCD